jgi:phospho-N-acetylmuramoyl-pentapeptide-transferase
MTLVSSLTRIFTLTTVSFAVAILLTPLLTHFLYKYRLTKKIREEAWDGTQVPVFQQFHARKEGTPTMGGILIWVTTAILTLIFNLSRSQTWLPVFTLVAAGLLGLVDDLLNIRDTGKVKGLGVRIKFLLQFLIAGAGAWWFAYKLDWIHRPIHVPLVGDFTIGVWYVPLFILAVVYIMNAVNITDGLDGLAGGALAASFAAYMGIAVVQGQIGIAAFCGTLIGTLLAFLWFNIHPARFFMGDTGSFAMGATLTVIAFLTNSFVVLPVVGFIFVLEGLSSLLQRFWKKYLGKKLFLSAPLHHHLEAIGWPEAKVTMRLWVIAAVTATIGMVIGLL